MSWHVGIVALLWGLRYSGVLFRQRVFGSISLLLRRRDSRRTGYGPGSHKTYRKVSLMFAIILGADRRVDRRRMIQRDDAVLGSDGGRVLPPRTWCGADGAERVWNANAGITAIDFAGGTVVTCSRVVRARARALWANARVSTRQHGAATRLTCGTGSCGGMVWLNAAALRSGRSGFQCVQTTTLAAAVAGFTWTMEEWSREQATVLGFCSGIVGGLG